MDDCLAQVAIDFGGRSWLVWDAEFNREKIGDVPTEMFYHFFKSFCDGAKLNANIKVEGSNEHHKIESIFKAFAKCIKTAVSKESKSSDIVQPGHIFPLKAMEGGVLSRAGHTEAACDLAKLAGLQSAGVICEIMNDDGTMARRDDLIKFGELHNLKVGTIADLIDYRLSSDSTVEAVNEKKISNEFGDFNLIVWRDKINDEYHFSLSKGDLLKVKSPLVRVQTQSILQDTLGIEDLGKNWSIRKSLERISKEEYVGIIVDILKLRKNVCLCRHFQSLNKDSLFSLERKSVFDPKTPKKLYIDVWLVDFFSPSYTNVCDTSSLFILQLVNITLSMSVYTNFSSILLIFLSF